VQIPPNMTKVLVPIAWERFDTLQRMVRMMCDTNESGLSRLVRLNDLFRAFGYSDVLSGSAFNNHIGNVRFREVVKQYQARYRSSCKSDKPLIALHIVLKLKGMSPPGRFLTREPVSSASKDGVFVESDYWYKMDDEKAILKVAQRLREKNSSSTAAKRRHMHEVGTKTAEEDCDSERASPEQADYHLSEVDHEEDFFEGCRFFHV
jgi:hypothetical protein